MQNFGEQTTCVMGDVQITNAYAQFWGIKTEYHV